MKGYVLETCPELVVKAERKTVLWRTQYAETWNRSQAICEKKDIRQSKKARQKEGRSMGEEPTSELCSRGQLLYVSPPLLGVDRGHQANMGTRQPVSEGVSLPSKLHLLRSASSYSRSWSMPALRRIAPSLLHA